MSPYLTNITLLQDNSTEKSANLKKNTIFYSPKAEKDGFCPRFFPGSAELHAVFPPEAADEKNRARFFPLPPSPSPAPQAATHPAEATAQTRAHCGFPASPPSG